MIKTISIKSFKSIENLDLELGRLNVFVGANGSGKSNILEGIGVLSAAADGKVNDQTLLQRGVRPGVPNLYKSAFPVTVGRAPSHIWFSGKADDVRYDVSLNNPLDAPSPAWLYKHELWEDAARKLASRGPNMSNPGNKETGLAALKAVELLKDDPALQLLRRLQSYVIYTPTTPVLRGVAPETQPRHPLGLSGGGLPDAVEELLNRVKNKKPPFKHIEDILDGVTPLIGWAKNFSVGHATELFSRQQLRLPPRLSRSKTDLWPRVVTSCRDTMRARGLSISYSWQYSPLTPRLRQSWRLITQTMVSTQALQSG